MDRKLRLGLLLDSFYLPAWERLMLEKVNQGGNAQITLVILQEHLSKTKPKPGQPFLYRLYNRIENRLSRPTPNAQALQDVSDLLRGVPVITIPADDHPDGEWMDEGARLIQSYDLDILLQTSFKRPQGAILKTARLGAWYYQPGEGDPSIQVASSSNGPVPMRSRSSPPGFWEVFEGRPVTGCALYQVNGDLEPPRQLYQSFSATDLLSVNGNCNRFLWKSASFVARAIKNAKVEPVSQDRHDLSEKITSGDMAARPGMATHRAAPAQSAEIPGNAAFARLLGQYLLRYGSNRLAKGLFHTQWRLFYGSSDLLKRTLQPGVQPARDSTGWLSGLKALSPPRPAFWSDPFVVYRDGLYFIFFEEFRYQKNKAHISLLVLGEDGIHSGPVVVLERPYHLSYPFLFEWDGSLFMLPETAGHRTIEVYRCVEFPSRWEFNRTLMEPIKAFDTTLFPHQGKWWMFTNLKENEGASSWDELFLFSADHPLSTQWTPHPANPVVSDVRRARPAGALFELDGALYRPSQDSSQGYGYGLNFNRIVAWNETEYREEVDCKLLPGWDQHIRGLHTFNQAGRMLVIDGKMRRFRFPSLV